MHSSVFSLTFSLPGNRPGTHFTGGWVGPRVGLDGCRQSRPHRDSIAGPPVIPAIPTHAVHKKTSLNRELRGSPRRSTRLWG